MPATANQPTEKTENAEKSKLSRDQLRQLTEIERQTYYTDKLDDDFKFPLFSGKQAVLSQRKSGYRTTAKAAREPARKSELGEPTCPVKCPSKGGYVMGRRRKKTEDMGECAYCPASATTRDHIPPQGMFAKGTPHKPWVGSCLEHNCGASLDDQYMQRLSMLWGADACKDAIDVGETFLKSLDREQARGLKAEVLRSLSPVDDEKLFPGGINMALQGERLGRVTDKLVRGWWFKLSGERVPEGYEIMKYQLGKRHSNPLYEVNERIIRTCPGCCFGDMAFTFRLAYCPNSLLTCWLFEFYKVFGIIAYTCKMGENDFQILDLAKPFSVVECLD